MAQCGTVAQIHIGPSVLADCQERLFRVNNMHTYNNNNNNIHICIAPYGRNFRGAGPGSVLVGVRRGKKVSLGEEKCL